MPVIIRLENGAGGLKRSPVKICGSVTSDVYTLTSTIVCLNYYRIHLTHDVVIGLLGLFISHDKCR